jgi:hypothetical protein
MSSTGLSSAPRPNPPEFALHLQVGKQHAKIKAQKLHSTRSTHVLHNVSILLLSISITQRESDAGGMIAGEVARLTALHVFGSSNLLANIPRSLACAFDDRKSKTASRNSMCFKNHQTTAEPCRALHIAKPASGGRSFQPAHKSVSFQPAHESVSFQPAHKSVSLQQAHENLTTS